MYLHICRLASVSNKPHILHAAFGQKARHCRDQAATVMAMLCSRRSLPRPHRSRLCSLSRTTQPVLSTAHRPSPHPPAAASWASPPEWCWACGTGCWPAARACCRAGTCRKSRRWRARSALRRRQPTASATGSAGGTTASSECRCRKSPRSSCWRQQYSRALASSPRLPEINTGRYRHGEPRAVLHATDMQMSKQRMPLTPRPCPAFYSFQRVVIRRGGGVGYPTRSVPDTARGGRLIGTASVVTVSPWRPELVACYCKFPSLVEKWI